jgi:hypothetical protein
VTRNRGNTLNKAFVDEAAGWWHTAETTFWFALTQLLPRAEKVGYAKVLSPFNNFNSIRVHLLN